jgi:hypothetical protein
VPRAKKAAGQAVDRRNGQHQSLSAVPLPRFGLPKRPEGWDLRTRRVWAALWADPVSSALSVVDREMVIRWAEALDDHGKALVRAREDPITEGRNDQPVASPWFAIAKQAMDIVTECERQIGVGALNRARLGIALIQERASLLDLAGRRSGGDEPDPRLS